MMRLIDADDVKKRLDKFFGSRNIIFKMESVKYLLDKAPTVDAVQVVRCKDCKYIKLVGHTPFMIYCCGNDKGLVDSIKENDYCSYGERKDDNNEKNRND